MATIKQGILGGFSGKIGNIVGSSWKGIAVMKTKPLSVANPQTAGQIAQREFFSDCVFAAKQILAGTIKPLWDRFAVKMSGYNSFVKENIGKIKPVSDLASKVKISNGAMAATEIDTSVINVDLAKLTVTWVDDTGEGLKLATDKAYIVAFDDEFEVVQEWPAGAARSAETSGVLEGAFTAGSDYHVYLAFRRLDGTVVSQTSYKLTTAPTP
jgi:hypothetical protein